MTLETLPHGLKNRILPEGRLGSRGEGRSRSEQSGNAESGLHLEL
jgi:hypothetical protein